MISFRLTCDHWPARADGRSLVLLFALILLAACNSDQAADAPTPAIAQATATVAPTLQPTHNPTATTEPTASASPTPTAAHLQEPTNTPAPPAADLVPPPPFSEHLRATDPSTVVLGAGKPQLIEFFAFW